MTEAAILVFSHLRWDFVFQRPQHLLSRLARKHRVIFFEEPLHSDSPEPSLDRIHTPEGVVVYRPRTNLRSLGFAADQIPLLRGLVEETLRREGLQDFAVWCYTPMAVPLIQALVGRAEAIVYDCMDELSAFHGAPPELLEQEKRLLTMADLVFTGGPSLYRAKKDRHPNVHCFPSSVDARHFGAARPDNRLDEAPEQANLPHPRLGFFGVIDERLDIPLLDAMAKTHPEWQIVMVGPVVKIPPGSLPKHPNIHYFGQRAYADLPKFLAGWDVCLLPFALNDSTKFISPTKTLEYMAAERPVVSTPITDVKEPYSDIVSVAQGKEFIRCCERALRMSESERQARVTKMREVLARTSWDATVASMEKLMGQVMTKPRSTGGRRAEVAAGPPTSGRRGRTAQVSPRAAADQAELPFRETPVREVPVAIVGAGPTGLSAAYHLGQDCLLIDQNDRVGGWCRSVQDRGFTFDFAGHIMFSNDPYVHEMYAKLLGDNVHWQDREAWVFSKGVYTRYPFQGSLYGLPPKVIKECIVGAIEARFGSLKTQADAAASKLHGGAGGNGSLSGTASRNGHGNGQAKACTVTPGDVKDCCADGIAESEVPLAPIRNHKSEITNQTEPANFEEFIYKVWGAGIAKHFAVPYNRKIWAVDLKEMETSWLGGRVPLPDLEEMIEGALSPAPKPMGPNARFGYPLRGGFQALMNGFLPHVAPRLLLNTRVVAVSPRSHTLTLSTGQRVRYEQLISTMPLPVLVRVMGDEPPADIRSAAKSLRHTSVRCVNIGIGREHITDKHWIYYPEDTVFHRIFVQGNASPHCNAPGGFGFTCEITYGPEKPLPCEGEDLIRRCIDDCIRMGFIRADDPIWATNQVDLPFAYVVYDHARKANVAAIRTWLAAQDIHLAGRYSEWEYYNSDHAFLAGKKAAEKVQSLQAEAATIRHLGPHPAHRTGAAFAPRSPAEKGWRPLQSPRHAPAPAEVEEEA